VNRLENRLRRLEGMFVHEPTAQEYLDARNREVVRALHKVAELLAGYGFDGDYLLAERERRMLDGDTSERRRRDREIMEAWSKAQGVDRATAVEGAKVKLEAMLRVRAGD
jgi:hypothetical protein